MVILQHIQYLEQILQSFGYPKMTNFPCICEELWCFCVATNTKRLGDVKAASTYAYD